MFVCWLKFEIEAAVRLKNERCGGEEEEEKKIEGTVGVCWRGRDVEASALTPQLARAATLYITRKRRDQNFYITDFIFSQNLKK